MRSNSGRVNPPYAVLTRPVAATKTASAPANMATLPVKQPP
jgi:hypothetical protein